MNWLRYSAFVFSLVPMGASAQVLVEPGSSSASTSFECDDFERLLHFIRSEHLRFRAQKGTSWRELFLAALDRAPEVMSSQGYTMMARDFARGAGEKIRKNWESISTSAELCEALEVSFYRLFFLKSFVTELDPYSDFYLSHEMSRRASVVDGQFVGVGVGTRSLDRYLQVTEVVEDGPAFGKVFEGDRISHIDGHSVRGLSAEELRQRIRGERGTFVEFRGLRADENADFVVKVERRVIEQKSVSHRWLDDGVLLVRIHRFFAQTAPQLQALLEVEKPRLKGLVLDLRDNPGGLLQGARDVVSLFVRYGVVVYLRGFSTEDDQMWAVNNEANTELPMVVLINENTASASEIVAGALRDYGRAILVGSQSFGKSSVQNIFETQSAVGTRYPGGLKLTTLWFYLPSGRSVSELRPDISIVEEKDSSEAVVKLQMPYLMPKQIQVPVTWSQVDISVKSLVESFGELKNLSSQTSSRQASHLEPSERTQPSVDMTAEDLGRALIQELSAQSR